MLPHDAPEEVFKTRHRCFLGGLVSSTLLGSDRLISGGGGRFSTSQAAVVVVLRVTVGMGQDYAVFAGLWSLHGGGRGKLATVGVIRMAEGLGWSLNVGLGARLHRSAVFVIVQIAVVALFGLAGDADLVADLVN